MIQWGFELTASCSADWHQLSTELTRQGEAQLKLMSDIEAYATGPWVVTLSSLKNMSQINMYQPFLLVLWNQPTQPLLGSVWSLKRLTWLQKKPKWINRISIRAQKILAFWQVLWASSTLILACRGQLLACLRALSICQNWQARPSLSSWEGHS